MDNTKGKLYLIPTPLSEENIGVIPLHVKEIIHTLSYFVVEHEKTARQFLKKVNYPKSFNEISLLLLNEHTRPEEVGPLLKPLLEGNNAGILSEAGVPAVADPGAALVRLAHENHIRVIPLTGPSSIILSLMASGLNGQSFSFAGYVPKEQAARINALREMEKTALKKNQTQIFIETPYRNQHLLEDILQQCQESTMLCIACELTGPNEFIKTQSIKEWKKKIPDINKRPAIFLIGR